ncbi:MAG: hypothetical protein QE271_12895 [Bacteriovoracaceae bacterium]|nr:hypothetical protein [Bacteriovoracaceae bacterium]
MPITKNDFISEENFTRLMSFVPSRPEDDSPGDSEKDAGAEFMMGMSYESQDTTGDDSEDKNTSHRIPEKVTTQKSRLIEKSMIMNSVLPSAAIELPSET